jgi:chaperone BCS1
MTTNRHEALDSALIRPGRVDHQIGFTLATREQIRDLYKRMYSADQGTGETKTDATATNSMHELLASCGKVPFDLRPHIRRSAIVEPEKLADLADLFANRLPENVFSPAAIQGYLLKRRRDPEGALNEIATWRDEEIHSMMTAESLLPNCSPALVGDVS